MFKDQFFFTSIYNNSSGMHSTHTPCSYAVVSLALGEFLCWDQDLTGSFPAVVPGTDLPLPSLEVLPQCSQHSATFRLNHLKHSSFLVSQLPASYYIFIREDESDREFLARGYLGVHGVCPSAATSKKSLTQFQAGFTGPVGLAWISAAIGRTSWAGTTAPCGHG